MMEEGARGAPHYRYTVKCDDVAHARLKQAARAAGVDEGVLAQRFFDKFVEAGCRDDFFAPDALSAMLAAGREVVAAADKRKRQQIHAAKSTADEMAARCAAVHRFLADLPKDRHGMTLVVLARAGEALCLDDSKLRSAINRLEIDRKVTRVSSKGLIKPGQSGVLFKVNAP